MNSSGIHEYVFTGDPEQPAIAKIINGRIHFNDMFRSIWGHDPWAEYRNTWHRMWEVKIPKEITSYQRLRLI